MPDQDDTWIDRTEPTLEWAIRGVMAQSANYRRFCAGLEKQYLARMERERLALPQFPVELRLPTIPRKPAGRVADSEELAS